MTLWLVARLAFAASVLVALASLVGALRDLAAARLLGLVILALALYLAGAGFTVASIAGTSDRPSDAGEGEGG